MDLIEVMDIGIKKVNSCIVSVIGKLSTRISHQHGAINIVTQVDGGTLDKEIDSD